jgi:hypothetical protein
MKKLVMTVAVFGCAATIATAQTVESANIVGYGKAIATNGQLNHIALNFDAGSSTLSDFVPASSVADFTVVNLWDKSANTYITATKTRAGWSADPAINLGDAFWITPAGAGTTEIILSGEAPLTATNSVVVSNLVATGYYYPVKRAWDDTAISSQAPDFSVLNIWNGTAYDTYTKTRAGWGTAGVEIDVTQGFWINPASTFNWDEPRPYTP